MGCRVVNAGTAAPDCGCPPIDQLGNCPHASDRLSDGDHLKRYSTDIAAAMTVVDHVNRKGHPWPFRGLFDQPITAEEMAFQICTRALEAVSK